MRSWFTNGRTTIKQVAEATLQQTTRMQKLNAFITLNPHFQNEANKLNELKPENNQLLFGVPIAIKDNFCTKQLLTSCASKILQGYQIHSLHSLNIV